jgi:hypothetical protein
MLISSPETRRLLRERRAEALDKARWGFAVARADDADCSDIERWALARTAEAAHADVLLAR